MPRKKPETATAGTAPSAAEKKTARKRTGARETGTAPAARAPQRAARTRTAASTGAAAAAAPAPGGGAAEQIARLAHAIYEARQRRGEAWGTPEGDWAYAEVLHRAGVTNLE